MLLLRIDDVGRPVDCAAWEGLDPKLEFFARWRAAAGLAGVPCCYGVIPNRLGEAECQVLSGLSAVEEVGCHGWSHERGEQVTATSMRCAVEKLSAASGRPVSSYIPPFNEYDDTTLAAWRAAGGRYFYGGRHGHDHERGHLPVVIDGLVHIPAYEPLYGRAPQLLELERTILRLGASAAPYVVTLHTVWDAHCLGAVADLVNLMRAFLQPTQAVDRWAASVAGSRGRFAAHGAQRLPIDHLVSRLKPGMDVLDFGARDGEWPYFAALHGATVSMCDRHPRVNAQLDRFAADLPGSLGRVVCADTLDWLGPCGFDLITALWAVQHNLTFEAQRAIVCRLIDGLRRGGELVLTGSLAPSSTYLWSDRADPMLRLNRADWLRLTSDLPGCREPVVRSFRYQHLNPTAEFTDDEPNAVLVEITKDQ